MLVKVNKGEYMGTIGMIAIITIPILIVLLSLTLLIGITSRSKEEVFLIMVYYITLIVFTISIYRDEELRPYIDVILRFYNV